MTSELTSTGTVALTASASREAEFAAVFDANVQAVYNAALTATRDRVVAEDITQSVFANALEHWDELRDRSRAKAWLLVSTSNLARMHFRDTRPVEPMDALIDRAAPGPLLEDAVTAQEAANLVWEAAGSLEPHHRTALDLRLRHGLTAGEVGDALCMPVNQASDLLDRANEALRTAVRALLVRRQGRDCPGLRLLLAEAGSEFTARVAEFPRYALSQRLRRSSRPVAIHYEVSKREAQGFALALLVLLKVDSLFRDDV